MTDTLAQAAVENPARLAAVRDSGLLDQPQEEWFDRLTRLAVKLLGVPVSFISLVDGARDFYVSQSGFGEPLASLRSLEGRTFCHFGLLSEGPLVVDDTTAGEPFASVPTVHSLGVRAYLGIPLNALDGHRLGSFCVIDFQPRHWSATDVNVLTELAQAAANEISLRKVLVAAQSKSELLTQLNMANQRRSEQLEKHRSQVLQLLVDAAPLPTILEAITTGIEAIDPSTLTSILLLDGQGKHLLKGAAPSLPGFYNDAIHGLAIGPGEGSCGTAAATGERVIVEDISTHPYWAPYKALAAQAGLASCWSEPIRDSRQTVLGTFAIYHRHRASPTPQDIALIAQAASLASIAIERKRTEQASRAKSEFLANMSHEIRTPLNAILGLTHLLRRSALDADQADKVGKITTAGRHLLSVINDILDFSKIESGNLELEQRPVELAALAGNMASMLGEAAAAKGIALVVQTGPIPRQVLGDSTRLTQAFLNLASNAVKFTERGSVTLRTVVTQETATTVDVRFEVQDTGIGIAPEVMPRLFQVFQQGDSSTTRRFGGTGLGLTITRLLAERMGGQAGVHSVLGQGSTFWFTARLGKLAASEAGAGKDIASTQPGDAIRRGYAGTWVLVAEDDEINQLVARELLESVGLRVDIAHDGQDAVERMQSPQAGSYALILMDMQMPRLDGLDATRQIRALPGVGQLPIIAMTANAFGEDRARCLEAGMDDFVTKPVEPEVLYGKMLGYLARHAA
ncbi:MAG: GAF domain-containing protein [Rhodoferax sp.]